MTRTGFGGASYIDQGEVGRALNAVGLLTTLVDRAQLTALFTRHSARPSATTAAP